ncbi:MAG: HPF/RaiA family ribosome-associated protein [Deltaproteobacteria bacterium]|jgi:ribosome-associated translation inhibitor RaiA|nr:HPF/RaiA family ribosome-associated protein [Deltaproteobacteria bacterium]
MLHVKFKNLDKSEMIDSATRQRLESLVDKFPDLSASKILVTLEMENSPFQAGPDFFKVKLHIARGRYDGIIIEKSDASIYVALAEVVDHMLEKLNRFGDRQRVQQRSKARRIARALGQISGRYDQKTG